MKRVHRKTLARPSQGFALVLRCLRGCSVALVFMLSSVFGASSIVAQERDIDPDAMRAQRLETVILSRIFSDDTVNTVLQIPVLADTYVVSNQPDTNFAEDTSLYVGYNLSGEDRGAERTLVIFDLAGRVPDNAVINNAYVELYEYAFAPEGDEPMGNIMRNLATAWSSILVTWNNHEPSWDGISEEGLVPAGIGWQQFPLTELVREWVNGTTANNGVIIIGDERVQERERIFYSLNAGNDLYPRLVIDYTVSLDTTPPSVTVNALPQFVSANFNVTWSGTDFGGSGIAYYDVQYMIPGQGWQDWQMHTTATSTVFQGGQNGVTYEFRARGVDNAGNVQPFNGAQAQTTVDSAPPFATVNPLPQYTFFSAFNVTWQGSDNPGGSGLAYYDVQYRIDGGSWQNWQLHVTYTGAQFTGAHDGTRYEFRVRAVDNVGNAQPFGQAQASTTVEIAPPTSHILPFSAPVLHTEIFPVSWVGQAEPGKSILYYDVRYRFDDGPWVILLHQTTENSVSFNASQGDGVYDFQVRATDNYGEVEPFTSASGAAVAVDMQPPFITQQMWIPAVLNVSQP
jgi:hypothetical protein